MGQSRLSDGAPKHLWGKRLGALVIPKSYPFLFPKALPVPEGPSSSRRRRTTVVGGDIVGGDREAHPSRNKNGRFPKEDFGKRPGAVVGSVKDFFGLIDFFVVHS